MIDLGNVVNLVQAGFTKSEIMAMMKESTSAAPDPKPAPAAPDPKPAPAPDPKPEPAPAPDPKPAADSVTLSDDQFAQLLQKFNLQNDSIDIPPDYDIKQKLSEHFKDVIIGQ